MSAKLKKELENLVEIVKRHPAKDGVSGVPINVPIPLPSSPRRE